MSDDLEQRVVEARSLLKPWASWANLDIPEELMCSGRYSPNDARFHYAVSEVMRLLDVEGGEPR